VFALSSWGNAIRAQPITYTCSSGISFTNAVEMIVRFPPGTYGVTILGVNNFDPKVAVLDGFGREIACVDDGGDTVRDYALTLPSTGAMAGSPLNSQAVITNRSGTSITYNIIVGGFGNTTGDFVALFEALAVTPTDGSGLGAGDAFSVNVTANMSPSPTPISAYMIGIDDSLDPMIIAVDDDARPLLLNGAEVFCDDGGTERCWGAGVTLAGALISTPLMRIAADRFDAMLTIPWSELGYEPGSQGIIPMRLTSFNQATNGRYVAAFHLGIAEPVEPLSPDPKLDLLPEDTIAVECNTTVRTAVVGEAGAAALVTCPTACRAASVWGTNIYSDDSSVCSAAAHAGVINLNRGGTFEVQILDGRTQYNASNRNGINSSPWGEWDRSFSVAPLPSLTFDPAVIAQMGPVNGVIIELDQSLIGNWNGIDAVELIGALPDGTLIRQWASDASATTEYDSNSTARQVTGEPDTVECRTFVNAWYSAAPNRQETLTVRFDQAVIPREISIVQTWSPGSITAVLLIPASGAAPVLIPDSSDPDFTCPHTFRIAVNLGEP
jgi:hypothetical protein